MNNPSSNNGGSSVNSNHLNALNSIYNKKQNLLSNSVNQAHNSSHHGRGSGNGILGSDDKLNLSVEVVNSQKIINKGGAGALDTSNNNLKLSRITEEKMNISVDGIQSSRGNNSNLHEKSIMLDGNSGQEDDKKKKDD